MTRSYELSTRCNFVSHSQYIVKQSEYRKSLPTDIYLYNRYTIIEFAINRLSTIGVGEPSRGRYVMFLGKTLYFHRASLHSRCQGNLIKCWGGNLRWTSIPSMGSSNTHSRFMLRKSELKPAC